MMNLNDTARTSMMALADGLNAAQLGLRKLAQECDKTGCGLDLDLLPSPDTTARLIFAAGVVRENIIAVGCMTDICTIVTTINGIMHTIGPAMINGEACSKEGDELSEAAHLFVRLAEEMTQRWEAINDALGKGVKA